MFAGRQGQVWQYRHKQQNEKAGMLVVVVVNRTACSRALQGRQNIGTGKGSVACTGTGRAVRQRCAAQGTGMPGSSKGR